MFNIPQPPSSVYMKMGSTVQVVLIPEGKSPIEADKVKNLSSEMIIQELQGNEGYDVARGVEELVRRRIILDFF